MRKLFVLAFKEILVTFRDVGALMSMILSPLLLTLAIGAAFGNGGSATLSDIPVLVLDRDQGRFSEELCSVLDNQQEEGLLAIEYVSEEAAARERVEADEIAALIIIPQNMSDTIVPMAPLVEEQLGMDILEMDQMDIDSLTPEEQVQLGQIYQQTLESESEPTVVEIFASPDYQISASVIKGIVQSVLERINMTMAGMNIIIEDLIQQQIESDGDVAMDSVSSFSAGFGEQGDNAVETLPISVQVISPSGRSFSWLDYSAASMAILFLMFGVTSGGRTLLAERRLGTLPRLLISPTKSLVILIGKMAGIVLTGILQVGILWGATSLIGAYWGPAGGVVVAIIALVIAATGVGALISAWSKSPGQAGAIGAAFTLIGAAASGSFLPRENLPQWLQTVSFITPNAWGIEIFGRLQSGGSLQETWPLLAGLGLLTLVYYLIAAFGFRRDFH
jgi:ABC-2 type transport system permease protein